jgi:hypothetical protein
METGQYIRIDLSRAALMLDVALVDTPPPSAN